ncbi:hypothetical protein GCM10027590_28150 [Nocardiopsis nanhaiensis]
MRAEPIGEGGHEGCVEGWPHLGPILAPSVREYDESEAVSPRLTWGFVVHPARHNANLQPVIEGPQIELLPAHAKVRRDGYRGSRDERPGAGE